MVAVEPEVEDDGGRYLYSWPTRSFSVWPRYHTVALNKRSVFELALEPETTYSLSTSGSLDLGAQGRTQILMYYAEGARVPEASRFGFLSPTARSIRGATKLYAWVFDSDPGDNSGRLNVVVRISKYIPERTVPFYADQHVTALSDREVVRVEGLDPGEKYRLVFRPDSPRVEDVPAKQVLCLHEFPRPRQIDRSYQWYDVKFVGEVSGVDGLTCMFLAWSNAGTSGVLEIDIERVGAPPR